jgi:hypothetical protein
MDKEPVRLWGKGIKTPFGVTGINNLDPENAEHRAFVDRLGIPDEIAEMTTRIYLNLFKLVTGLSLDNYQRQFMTRP